MNTRRMQYVTSHFVRVYKTWVGGGQEKFPSDLKKLHPNERNGWF